MGAAASASQKPMTAVDIKNGIGVLYETTGAKEAFETAGGKDDADAVVAWADVKAFAEQHDARLLDPRQCMFQNLKAFKEAREQIEEIARVHIKGAVKEIPWRAAGKELKPLGDDARQCGLDGEPATSLDALYEVAALAKEKYDEIMTKACPGSVTLELASLKGRDRAGAKARDEYKDMTAPCYSWLFDVVRGSALCETEADIVSLYKALEANPDVEIVRVKNRFDPPLFNGYRDILMNVAVKVENVSHLCELQIHLVPIKESEPLHKSHVIYEFFRAFFLGNADAVEERLKLLTALPVDDAKDVGELVDLMLGSDQYAGQLDSLCELLTSISEYVGVVKVRKHIFAEKERAFGAESKEVGAALYDLGDAYWRQGDNAKARNTLERALPVYEREYGSDGAEVAKVMNHLGVVYMGLGDYAMQRKVLERALPIRERALGGDHPEVAKTLNNLGNAYGDLGDQAKKRDTLERALAINERAYGRDHTRVATTLASLGNAYGSLGDYAKKRDLLERALMIEERAYGRDHTEVAITLSNLGNAYGQLGDNAKKRDMLERALVIKELTYGPDHVKLGIPLWNLAMAYGRLGNNKKKRKILERALAINERAYGPDHSETVDCREALADLA